VLLFTPSLVDFSDWLDDEERSDLESQVRLMERMQRMNWDAAHMHGFVAFNPWRQIEDLEAGRSPTAFDLAKLAIHEMGFVGIKLYPPMGFLPIGNAGSGLPYPVRAANIPHFPTKIDAALDALYAWAAQEGVAVMAHATNSQGAAEGYALRARPDRWAPVLAKYPALRLNLGHFGGFDEVGDDNTLDETWEYFFGRLVQGGPSNVFADMSYLSEVLPGGTTAAHRAALLGYLRAFLQQYDRNCERLMYGSDFAMLVREADYEEYLDSFRSYIAKIELSENARSRLYRDNAVKYLGLNKNAPTRSRLDAYYAKHGLDPAWLSSLDQE
jgi:predicted TIM-barrel fold metal-dependent hydrolase